MAQAVVTEIAELTFTGETSLSATWAALTAGHTQAFTIASEGSIVVTPPSAAWTLQQISDTDAYPNTLQRFERTSAHAGETATWTFSAPLYGKGHRRLITGVAAAGQSARNVAGQSTYQDTITPPGVNSQIESVGVVEICSGQWPRSTASAMTEMMDAFVYATNGGVSLTIAHQDKSSGAVTFPAFTTDDADTPGNTGGDFYRVFSTVYSPPSGGGGGSDPVISGTTTAPFVYAPNAISASNVTQTTATLTLQDSSTDETGFEWQYRVVNASWIPGGTTAANVWTLPLSTLTPNTTYVARARALRGVDSSAWVQSSQFTTAAVTADPVLPPTSFQATATTSTTVTLTWVNNAPGQTGVELWFGVPGFLTLVSTAGPTETTRTVIGLVAGGTYQAYLVAVQGSERSVQTPTLAITLPLTDGGGGTGGTGGTTADPGGTTADPDECCRITRNRALRGRC